MYSENHTVEVFNEKTLKNAICSAVLMSLIDGHLHEKEWEIIQSFAAEHWKEEYEDFDQYQDKVRNQVRQELEKLAADKETLKKSIECMVQELTPELTSQQKNIVLNLVGDVMVADGIMTLEESKLFAVFMDKMGLRIS